MENVSIRECSGWFCPIYANRRSMHRIFMASDTSRWPCHISIRVYSSEACNEFHLIAVYREKVVYVFGDEDVEPINVSFNVYVWLMGRRCWEKPWKIERNSGSDSIWQLGGLLAYGLFLFLWTSKIGGKPVERERKRGCRCDERCRKRQ